MKYTIISPAPTAHGIEPPHTCWISQHGFFIIALLGPGGIVLAEHEKPTVTHRTPTHPLSFLPPPRAMMALLCVSLALTFLLGPLEEVDWHRNPLGTIPPGREATISTWLEILRAQGFHYEDAEIGREHIAFKNSGGNPPCSLRLSRRGAAPNAPHTNSFAVEALSTTGDTQTADSCKQIAVRAIGILGPHDDGFFFHQGHGEQIRGRALENRKGPPAGFIIRPMLETLTWLALLVLMWSLISGVLSTFRSISRHAPWILVATLCAVGLRIWLPPAGPVHANEHGILELLSYTPAATAPGHSVPVGLYGYGGHHLFRAFATISGLSGTALLLFGGIILGLCTPLIAVALRVVGCGEFVVRLGTFAYALTPIFLRTAPTESPLMLGAFLALLGYISIFRSLDQRRLCWSSLLLGAGMVILAAQVHLTTLAWLLPILGLPFVVATERRGAAMTAAGLVILCSGPHTFYIVDTFLFHGTRGINPLVRLVEQLGEPAIAPLNPFLVPFAWLPLGVLALFKLPARPRAFAWLTFTPVLLLSVSVSQNFSDVLRYQAPLALFLLLLASWGAENLIATAESVVERRAYAWGLSACVLATGLLSLPVAWVTNPESEIARTVEAAAADGLLDQGLIAPVPSSDATQKRPTALPSWALPSSAPRNNPNAPYVLLGPRCLHQPSEEPGDYPPLDPGCAKAVQKPLQAIRVAEKTPDEFAGLPVWFMPRRADAPRPGIYQAR